MRKAPTGFFLQGKGPGKLLIFVEVFSQSLGQLIAANVTPMMITTGTRTRPAMIAVFLLNALVVIAKFEGVLSCQNDMGESKKAVLLIKLKLEMERKVMPIRGT